MKNDVIIVGGGPGGSAAAMFLLKEGIKPIIIEQEEFPRFHIGESMTGEAGGVLRRLGLEKEMTDRRYPVKHGVRVFGTSNGSSQLLEELKTGSSKPSPPGRCDGAILI